MRNPRTPGGSISGALNSLAGDALPITQADPQKQRDRAAKLNRVADFLLTLGWHLQAERLAHRAGELREEIPSRRAL